MYRAPLAYFISFRTYGTWLHGDARGSVDRRHNVFGTPKLAESANREQWEKALLHSPPVVLSAEQRDSIERTIRAVCEHESWRLHELNVRTNHVHVIVTAPKRPELVMNTFKSWATRRLREAGLVGADSRVWSRHGSTIYLFTEEKFREKCGYVRDFQ